MSNHRVQNILIGDGTAMPAGNAVASASTILAGDLAVVGPNMKTLTPGDTIADAESIFLIQGKANGELKRSMEIPGRRISKFQAQAYTAASRHVWAIGYNRKLAAGDIAVDNSVDYDFAIVIKNDKNLYSERAFKATFSITSAAAATQSSIATQIKNAINNDARVNRQIEAIVVGDGTGVYGVTGATNFGVEITSKVLVQSATSYKEERVYFEVFLDKQTGFSTTTENAVINSMSYGAGTYQQVYNMENFNFGHEGVLNRTNWPIPTLVYAASSSLVDATIVPTASATIAEDKVTFSATVAVMLAAGDFVKLDGVAYEIKYFISATVAILTAPMAATIAGVAVIKRMAYDLINIEFSNPNMLDGAGVQQDNKQAVVIAVPAGVAGSAYTVQSVQLVDLLAILNPYMASVPAGLAPVSL